MIKIDRFERRVTEWARARTGQFQYLWPLKGGWEGWLQVDLMSYFLERDSTTDILREQEVYANSRQRVDLLLNTDAVPVDRIPIEMKADSLNNRSGFLTGVREDLTKLEPQNRTPTYQGCDCLMLALTYDQVAYDWLHELEWGPQDVHIFGDIYLSRELAVLGAHIDRNGVWRRAPRQPAGSGPAFSLRPSSALPSSPKKGPALPTRTLSDYGLLGYGINVMVPQPEAEIAAFTYEAGRIFQWNGEQITLPDQVIVTETPQGKLLNLGQSGRMVTARDYQLTLNASAGLSATDPETDLTFSGDASFVNEMFKQTSTTSAFQLHEACYDFTFLTLSNVMTHECLRPDVRSAAEECQQKPSLINSFFDTFGTHVLGSAAVGGQFVAQTIVTMNSETSKQVSQTKLDISAEVRAENDAYVEGGLGFRERDSKTSELYRKVTRKSIALLGGDITAPSYDYWRDTLAQSAIPTQEQKLGVRKGMAARAAGVVTNDEKTQNLGLVNLKYEAMPEVLHRAGAIDKETAKVWEETLIAYMSGRNPFDKTPQRLAPDMNNSYVISQGQRATHEMRGWFATYKTFVGLKALPGSRAEVRCISDAEPGGWTYATVYAGEVVELRPKTAYLSKYMWIEFVKSFDDPNAELYTENRLVSW